jgi:hypothetical protein
MAGGRHKAHGTRARHRKPNGAVRAGKAAAEGALTLGAAGALVFALSGTVSSPDRAAVGVAPPHGSDRVPGVAADTPVAVASQSPLPVPSAGARLNEQAAPAGGTAVGAQGSAVNGSGATSSTTARRSAADTSPPGTPTSSSGQLTGGSGSDGSAGTEGSPQPVPTSTKTSAPKPPGNETADEDDGLVDEVGDTVGDVVRKVGGVLDGATGGTTSGLTDGPGLGG